MKKIYLTLTGSLSCLFAFALNPADFSVTRVTSPYFVVDGNSPATGPLSAYVGFKVTNTSSTTYSNLKFTISSISTSVSGQNYSLIAPSNGITLVGTLAPAETKVCYYYVGYPANTTPQATFNYSLTDATASSKSGTSVVYNRSAISANAGGLATQSINSQDLIGGIVYDDVTYTLGNIRNGDEADFQISVSTSFDPSKLTLLKSQVISSNVPGVVTNTIDQLYYTTTANQSSGSVTIRWTFRISAYNFTTLVLPYAGATSGASNYKYAISTDLGSGTPITISSAANPLVITKTSDQTTYGTNNTAVFTVTIQNPGAYPISIDKITDEIPAGFSYLGLDASSGVTNSNTTSRPSAGATGTITYEGGVVSSSNQSFYIAAGTSIVLKYSATTAASPASNLLTTAKGYVAATQFGSADNTVNVTATLPVRLTSFTGKNHGLINSLTWTTASESGSLEFQVERLMDGNSFQEIGRVPAKGNSIAEVTYQFDDPASLPGNNLYRLKLIDNDGHFIYSDVITIVTGVASRWLAVPYPNPFQSSLSLDIAPANPGSAQISLFNCYGMEVFRQQANIRSGHQQIHIELPPGLAGGNYFLKIDCAGSTITQKLAKVF